MLANRIWKTKIFAKHPTVKQESKLEDLPLHVVVVISGNEAVTSPLLAIQVIDSFVMT